MTSTLPWFSLADRNRAVELFNEAQQKVKDDPKLTARVLRARLPLELSWLTDYYPLKRTSKQKNMQFLGPGGDPLKGCDEFVSNCEKFASVESAFAETGPISKYIGKLRKNLVFPKESKFPLPAELKDIPPSDVIDIQEDSLFNLVIYEEWVSNITDTKASNGKAGRVSCEHVQWAVGTDDLGRYGDELCKGKWHCYAVVRCETGPDVKEGKAFLKIGFDNENKKNLPLAGEEKPSIKDFSDGEYHLVDFGVHDHTNADIIFRIAPLANPKEMKAIYVDRFIFVKTN